MKKFICLVMITAAGLGGYWLGQQPDSPRIFDWMNCQADQFEAEGGSQWVSETIAAGREGAATVLSQIRGDAGDGRAADQPRQDAPKRRPVERQPIPQCW